MKSTLQRALPLHLAPGLLVAATAAMAASFLSISYGAPVMLFALLLGIAFNFLAEEGRCIEGILAASKQVLQIGVTLLGVRITFTQIAKLGPIPAATVASSVVLTMIFGIGVARVMGLPRQFGLLTGGSVAICGVSAALAISTALPKYEGSERDTTFTVVSVVTLSSVAMIVYPLIAAAMRLDHTQTGVFLGATIHDVAQVVGAGYSVSVQTGDVATLVKLARVALLMPVIVVLLAWFGRRGGDPSVGKLPIPIFLIAFPLLVGANSAHLIAEPVRVVLVDISRWCLVIAIAALGMKTSLKALAEVGHRALTLIVAETIFLALLVLGVIVFSA
jgi:uncharacterized integral membrane protein (TIGR00698 family)